MQRSAYKFAYLLGNLDTINQNLFTIVCRKSNINKTKLKKQLGVVLITLFCRLKIHTGFVLIPSKQLHTSKQVNRHDEIFRSVFKFKKPSNKFYNLATFVFKTDM